MDRTRQTEREGERVARGISLEAGPPGEGYQQTFPWVSASCALGRNGSKHGKAGGGRSRTVTSGALQPERAIMLRPKPALA
jgi:hypothetical protein